MHVLLFTLCVGLELCDTLQLLSFVFSHGCALIKRDAHTLKRPALKQQCSELKCLNIWTHQEHQEFVNIYCPLFFPICLFLSQFQNEQRDRILCSFCGELPDRDVAKV